MNVSLRVPRMTRDQFLDWAEQQDLPYEFDGFEPVEMAGGTRRHGRLCSKLLRAIGNRLDGGMFEAIGEAGVATTGNAVRYPDLVILQVGGGENDRLMPDVIAVFEVLSPSTSRLDYMTKLREYWAVPSIQRYVIVDNTGPGMIVFTRPPGHGDWTATALMAGETLSMPELGIDVPVDDIFAGITFD